MVLLIVGVLLGGMLIPLTSQMEGRRLTEARQGLADIKEALLGFAVAQGRLPCPADPTIPSGTTGVGSEDCTLTRGVLPWSDLGLSETDPWGHRYTYRVTDSFKDTFVPATVTPPSSCADVPTLCSFALCSEGNITVSNGLVTIASKVPAVVLSHGKNGLGAWLPSGTQVAGASGDEQGNADSSSATFVDRTPGVDFDDVVTWVPLGILLNRMVTVGRLP